MGKQTAQKQLFAIYPLHTGRRRHREALGLPDSHAYRVWCRENGFGASEVKTWRQRREEKRHAVKLAARNEALAVLNRHICDIGLPSRVEYEAWRRARGFTAALHKSEARRVQEARTARREYAASALLAHERAQRIARQAESDPSAWIQAILERDRKAAELPAPFLRSVAHVAYTENNRRIRARFLNLLLAICRNSDLLRVGGGLPCMAQGGSNTYLYALLALARRHDDWIRAPEDWQPTGKNARGQFRSLARHLLAFYDVPAFMDRAWFEGDGSEARRHQGWFAHVGKGGNLRTADDIPFPLTKMAAHHALKAPADFSFHAALRWGQVRGAGGSERLARAVAASSLLSLVQCEEAFWQTVIVWFVNHPDLDTTHVGPILDYIYTMKYAPRESLRADGEAEYEGEIEYIGPAEPDFDMKGRTPASLLRRVEAWHQQLARESHRPPREWERMNVGEFLLEQHDPANDAVFHWTIRELLCSRELEEEGKAMNNCVASYIEQCVQGSSRIWSLRVAAPNATAPQRVMTIEVDPEKRAIVQARGKCNVTPDAPKCPKRLKLAPSLLRRWAAQQNMTLDPDAW